MDDIFSAGLAVNLEGILLAREWREERISALTADFPGDTIISLKLNIPGPIKNNEKFQEIFEIGWKVFCQDAIGSEKYLERQTGPEGFLVMMDDLETVKRDAIDFEENSPLGRLFDSDVMKDGRQLSRTTLGLPPRTCFVCERHAKECARVQRHSAEEIQKAINKLVNKVENSR